jgi:hypothetical protein
VTSTIIWLNAAGHMLFFKNPFYPWAIKEKEKRQMEEEKEEKEERRRRRRNKEEEGRKRKEEEDDQEKEPSGIHPWTTMLMLPEQRKEGRMKTFVVLKSQLYSRTQGHHRQIMNGSAFLFFLFYFVVVYCLLRVMTTLS